MSVEENIEVVRRLAAALSAKDWGAVAELIDEDCEWVSVPSGVTRRGRDALIEGYRKFTAAFPDFFVETVRAFGAGELVANEWSARGTHEGPLELPDGVHPPTGRAFARTGVGIAQVRNGRIVAYRDYFDRLTMTEQLGLG